MMISIENLPTKCSREILVCREDWFGAEAVKIPLDI